MKKFLNSIKRKYIFYIIAIIAAVFISFYSITLRIEPKKENKFGILIEGFEINISENDVVCSENIYKKNVYNINSNGLGIFISAQSETSDYDLLFVTKTSFLNNSYTHALLELNENNIKNAFPDYLGEYLIKEDKMYGLDITDFIKQYSNKDLENEYYVCFFKNSVHSGNLNDKSSSESINFINELFTK